MEVKKTVSGERYLINMRDGRVILFTKQANRQVDYHMISAEIAHAIEEGRITPSDVIGRIKANLINNQEEWDDLLNRKTTSNVRRSTITPDDSEGSETVPGEDEPSKEFDMDIPGAANGQGAPGAKKKGGQPKNRQTTPPASAPAPAPAPAPADETPVNGEEGQGDKAGDDGQGAPAEGAAAPLEI